MEETKASECSGDQARAGVTHMAKDHSAQENYLPSKKLSKTVGEYTRERKANTWGWG